MPSHLRCLLNQLQCTLCFCHPNTPPQHRQSHSIYYKPTHPSPLSTIISQLTIHNLPFTPHNSLFYCNLCQIPPKHLINPTRLTMYHTWTLINPTRPTINHTWSLINPTRLTINHTWTLINATQLIIMDRQLQINPSRLQIKGILFQINPRYRLINDTIPFFNVYV